MEVVDFNIRVKMQAWNAHDCYLLISIEDPAYNYLYAFAIDSHPGTAFELGGSTTYKFYNDWQNLYNFDKIDETNFDSEISF